MCLGGYDPSVMVFSSNSANAAKPNAVITSAMTAGSDIKSAVTSLAFRPGGSSSSVARNVMLVTCSDGGVSHWHMGSMKELDSFYEEGNQVLTAAYSPTGLIFATAGKDHRIRVYDEEKRTLITTLKDGVENETMAHSNRIQSIKFSSDDPNVLVSGGWDMTVQIWDVRQPIPVRSFYGPYLTGDGLDVHGEMILTGSSREKDQLQLWSLGSGKKIGQFEMPLNSKNGHQVDPTSLMTAKFSHSGRFIGAGGTNDFRVFDINTGGIVGEVSDQGTDHCVFGCAFSSDDKKILVTGAGPEAFLLE